MTGQKEDSPLVRNITRAGVIAGALLSIGTLFNLSAGYVWGQVGKPAAVERERAMQVEKELAEAIAKQERANSQVVDRLDTMLLVMGTKPGSEERRALLRKRGLSSIHKDMEP